MAEIKNSVICDSSALISLTDACFLPLLAEMKERMDGYFIIPPSVEGETIRNPIRTQEHSLAATRMKQALAEGVLTVMRAENLEQLSGRIVQLANSVFSVGDRPLRILHSGEAEALALSASLGVPNIMIDERTARMLFESPNSLRKHLENEFSARVFMDNAALSALGKIVPQPFFFRSAELVALAYEKGFFARFAGFEKDALRASLYGVKFAGCGISFDEINNFMKRV